MSIDYPKRTRRHQFFKNEFHFASAGPNLASMNGINTLGKLFAGVGPREGPTRLDNATAPDSNPTVPPLT